jgi:Domain of unknown function (4846)
MNRSYFLCCLFFFISCQSQNKEQAPFETTLNKEYKSVQEIPQPEGFHRVSADENTFGGWLRNIHLKQDKHVYLYDGTLKKRQSAQFAVMDIPIGDKNLQQCADAVIRLRAEYLFAQKRYDEIVFADNDGKEYKWEQQNDYPAFEKYLETVFGWCGSASLEKQLSPVPHISSIEAGNVFIKGGFPGHAMIVVDVAVNEKGEKVFMLAQSYMPAQDIHIVRNPMDEELSPWYRANNAEIILTPEWKFTKNQLRRF